ncbi:MAG: flavin reductase, partial [Haloferacaceae archaeon]
MEFDPNDLDGFELFLTLGRLVSPRPVGWISTTDGDGIDNVAPYSFVTPVSVDPPVVAFQAAPHPDGTPKDTARNAIDTGEFVYNLVVDGVLEPMNDSAAHLAESEFDAVGIEREPAAAVAP